MSLSYGFYRIKFDGWQGSKHTNFYQPAKAGGRGLLHMLRHSSDLKPKYIKSSTIYQCWEKIYDIVYTETDRWKLIK